MLADRIVCVARTGDESVAPRVCFARSAAGGGRGVRDRDHSGDKAIAGGRDPIKGYE